MNNRYCNGMVHVIKPGETLYQLSRRYRVPLALILRANPYVDVYNLQSGQEICIPVVRPYNGMICMPVQQMNRGEGMPGMEEENFPTQSEMAAPADEGQMPVSGMENERERDRETEAWEDEEDDAEEIEKNESRDMDDDDVEIYITSGGRSLGDILNEYGVKWEDFIKNNDLQQIALGEDVVLYLPKKTMR